VRQFLARRETLARDARRELALRLAAGLRAKVTGAPEDLGPERFLEQLSALTSGRADPLDDVTESRATRL
jgi:hypothetical protein